jgi:unsaturated chondroitin disaccharide hydrolase
MKSHLPGQDVIPPAVDDAWSCAVAKLRVTSRRIGATFPHATGPDGRYDAAAPSWWTAGFWPGMMWLAYRDTTDDGFRVIAEACEDALDATVREFDELYHDVGFMWSLTAVARYKLIGAEESRRRGLIAASLLAARFNLRGRFLRAWNEDKVGWAIVDSMMNLPLLYWAAEITGDPRFRYFALAHADTTLQHFVRADGSCRHIVCFDPATGEVVGTKAGQGSAPDSAWARGTAWALYGFALSYRSTQEPRYLEAAQRIADFFVSHLPADSVPYWDFRVPITPETPRDTSAAACAASGLLELARLAPSPAGARYRAAAMRVITALLNKYAVWDAVPEGLLRQGAGNVPEGRNISVSLIYGDYFFLEALAKLREQHELFW